jgi:flagellar biosynthesis/type III secretory pathway chaperone
MSDRYADLLEVLRQQSGVVDELIELGLAETDAFKIDDVPRIIAIVDRQKEAVNRMCALERRKAELMNGNTLLREIFPMSGRVMGEIRNEVENAVSCLVDRARRLQKINETNRLLARMSLSYTRMMQKALGIAANGSYDQKGMPAAPQGYLGRLDASA